MVAVIRPSPTEVESWRELEDMLDAWEIPLCRSGLGISGFGCAARKTSPLQEGARSPQGARSPDKPQRPSKAARRRGRTATSSVHDCGNANLSVCVATVSSNHPSGPSRSRGKRRPPRVVSSLGLEFTGYEPTSLHDKGTHLQIIRLRSK